MIALYTISGQRLARFFAKALGIDPPSIEGIPDHKGKAIQSLSKEIPSSPATIERRLMLLALPEKVQNMVEVKPKDGGLLLGAAELISRLRGMDDKEYLSLKYGQ